MCIQIYIQFIILYHKYFSLYPLVGPDDYETIFKQYKIYILVK